MAKESPELIAYLRTIPACRAFCSMGNEICNIRIADYCLSVYGRNIYGCRYSDIRIIRLAQ